MNEIDRAYWNGYLEGITALELKARILTKKKADLTKEEIMREIAEIKQMVERLKAEDTLAFLMKYKD